MKAVVQHCPARSRLVRIGLHTDPYGESRILLNFGCRITRGIGLPLTRQSLSQVPFLMTPKALSSPAAKSTPGLRETRGEEPELAREVADVHGWPCPSSARTLCDWPSGIGQWSGDRTNDSLRRQVEEPSSSHVREHALGRTECGAGSVRTGRAYESGTQLTSRRTGLNRLERELIRQVDPEHNRVKYVRTRK